MRRMRRLSGRSRLSHSGAEIRGYDRMSSQLLHMIKQPLLPSKNPIAGAELRFLTYRLFSFLYEERHGYHSTTFT